MKKLLLLFFAALCIIIASCSKDSGFMPGPDPVMAYGKGYPAHTPVIVLPPNNDGENNGDTDDFMAAIASAEPGTVIQLTEGVYHLAYLELIDFNGSIVGAGRNKTMLYPEAPIDNQSQLNRNIVPSWWRFIGGNILIANLTFDTTVPEPIQNFNHEPWMGKDLFAMLIFNDYDVNSIADNTYQKVLIKNVDFIGGYDDAGGDPGSYQWMTDHNVIEGLWIGLDYGFPIAGVNYPLTKGEYIVENCYFEHILSGIEAFGIGEKASTSLSDCSFNNCMCQAYFTTNFNSRITLTNNVFSGSTGNDIVIEDTDWGLVYGYAIIEPIKRTRYTLTGNIFNVTPNTSSVVLWDDWVAQDQDDILPMQLKVNGNIFNLTEGSTGITAINSQDAIIDNNRFKGTCLTGIMVDGIPADRFGTPLQIPDKAYADNVLLLGNNLTALESAEADIILGVRSRNCTVVGAANDEIIDNGSNNKITGIKPLEKGYQFGPSIRDNFQMWQRGRQH